MGKMEVGSHVTKARDPAMKCRLGDIDGVVDGPGSWSNKTSAESSKETKKGENNN